MNDVLDSLFEVIIYIIVCIIAAASTLSFVAATRQPVLLNVEDKTMIESIGTQYRYEAEVYGRDLLLMLLNTDAMSPFPKGIKINDSPVIRIDNEFISHKMENIGVIYSSSGAYKLSAMLDYIVKSTTYVYKSPDIPNSPYIHYVLERKN